MKRLLATALVCLISVVVTRAQDAPEPTISNEPLTEEQIAIYRTVLAAYRKGDNEPLNLSNKTELLRRSDGSSDLGCLPGVKLIPNPEPRIHKIVSSASLGAKLLLVDPDRQDQVIDQNDPQNLVKRAIDDHEPVTEEQIDESVKRAFETGVFAVSEIAFDKDHRFALVSYSFVCGGLCGNGDTLMLKRAGQKWRVIKRCGGWVS